MWQTGCHTSYLFTAKRTEFMLLHSFWMSFMNTTGRTSDGRKLNGLVWRKRKKHRQVYLFCLPLPTPPALSFILIFHFCHPFLSRSFAFLCTEACSFLSREQFKEIYFWTRESCSMSNAADDWGWTSSLSFCTTFLFPPLHTDYPISPHR